MTDQEICIAIIDNDLVVPSDAIILLEGDGLNRLKKCAELFHAKLAPVICFSGGAENIPYGSFPFKMFLPELEKYGLTKTDFLLEEKSQHTYEQAVEVLRIAEEKKWREIILVASGYHQYRAYLTFVKVCLEKKQELAIINSPARDLKWFEPAHGGTRFELMQKEFQKIDEYGAKGHLATYKEAIDYQKWKEKWISQQ